MAEIQADRVYKIANVKSATVIDLSGTDGYTISGWNDNGGHNQRWRIEKQGNQWIFRNVASGRYLGLSSPSLQDGTRLQGVDEPFAWNIFRDKNNDTVYRIFVPDHQLNIDLDCGDAANGAKIHLWNQWDAHQQTWKFEEV